MGDILTGKLKKNVEYTIFKKKKKRDLGDADPHYSNN
jgi:hypothetical protein